MERNDYPGDATLGSTGASNTGTGSTSGSNVGGGMGSTSGGTTGGMSGGTTGGTTGGSASGGGMADRARDLAGTAQEKLADAGSMVRERASGLRDTVADALESGSDRLRNKLGSGSSGQLAGATGSGVATLDDGRVSQAGDAVAGGMKATADWLRDADLDGLRMSVERQVKEHPGRTLLIAAGLGYVLGKAFRK